MSVKCQVVMEVLDRLAPRYLAESWDNVGLLVGSPSQTIKKILVTLDVNDKVVEKAVENEIDMIIAHHPLIFKPLNNVRTDLPYGRRIARLLKADIAVFSVHTNLDVASGGVNDILAQRLRLQSVKPLAINYTERLLKLVVFVPKEYAEQVRNAMTQAGAGHIGNYSHCTFQTEGMGTFLPLEGTNPFIGQKGKVEYVSEVRLETIMPEGISRRVVKAMLKSHPYEEVAYDLYQLSNSGAAFGLGRFGKLMAPITLNEFISQVKDALGIDYVNVAGALDRIISKVAVCGGSGAGLISKAAFKGADVLVTGDVKYHEAQDALQAGMAVIDAGHFATEQPIIDTVVEYLKQCSLDGNWQVDIAADQVNKNVFNVF